MLCAFPGLRVLAARSTDRQDLALAVQRADAHRRHLFALRAPRRAHELPSLCRKRPPLRQLGVAPLPQGEGGLSLRENSRDWRTMYGSTRVAAATRALPQPRRYSTRHMAPTDPLRIVAKRPLRSSPAGVLPGRGPWWRSGAGTPALRHTAGPLGLRLVAASTHGPDFRLLFLGALGVSVLSLRLADALVWREAVTRVRAGGKNSRLGVAVGPDLGVTRMVRVPTAVGPALSKELLKSKKRCTVGRAHDASATATQGPTQATVSAAGAVAGWRVAASLS